MLNLSIYSSEVWLDTKTKVINLTIIIWCTLFYLCVWQSERQEATRRYEQTTIYVSFLELEIHLKVNNIGSLNDPLNEGQ